MRAMVRRSSVGIGKTVHLAVDWGPRRESAMRSSRGLSGSRGAAREALLPSDVNIRKDCENGKPEALNQRRERNAETRACVHSMMGETNAPGKQASGLVGLQAMQTF
jgi:hypothetical protein